MKYLMRLRYVPEHFHRDLQKCFRKLTQGTRSVEDYFEEFEKLMNSLELEESEEAMMAQFIDGLQDRIQRKVERAKYKSLHELLHLSVQIEQQIKCKNNNNTRTRNVPQTWRNDVSKLPDKGKTVEIDSRFKSRTSEPQRSFRDEQGKSSNQFNRTHDITCFKCQGRGHMAKDCPNRRVMIITNTGEYESQDEAVDESDEHGEDIEYPDTGESLMIRRVLNVQVGPEETAQRENLFHTRCTINGKVCNLIIDGGSCTNVASKLLVEKLGLVKTKHPRPYKLRWLNDKAEMKVSEQVMVPFSIGKYVDQVTCDVVPMQDGHLLLGRPWQFDRETQHDGRTNQYSVTHQNRKFTLAPLSPSQVHAIHAKMAKDGEVSTSNLYVSYGSIGKSLGAKGALLLMFYQECLSADTGDLDIPEEVQPLLQSYLDIFPEELPPGLPPLRGIEHQIDLVPGSALPNKPAYRMNPEESQELEKQIRDLLNQGYI